MNPILLIIILIFIVLLWFLLAFAFRPIGKFFKRLFDDAISEINKDDE